MTIVQNAKLTIPSNLPSYIAPQTFALALINQIAGNTPITLDGLKQQIAQSTDIPESVKASLSTLIGIAGGNLEKAIANIENWYSNMGERVSGWYKRHAQYVAFGMALAIAVVGNVDTLIIAKSLMMNSTLREQISNAAEQYTQSQSVIRTQNLNQISQLESAIKLLEGNKEKEQEQADKQKQLYELQAKITEDQTQQLSKLADLGLPIGWDANDQRKIPGSVGAWIEKLLGWFITTLAVSLGAPFWFDLLNKFMNFRDTMKPKPEKTE